MLSLYTVDTAGLVMLSLQCGQWRDTDLKVKSGPDGDVATLGKNFKCHPGWRISSKRLQTLN